MNKKETLHKILNHTLEAETEKELLNSSQSMRTQEQIWELTSNDKPKAFDKKATLSKIEKQLFSSSKTTSKLLHWRYIAASLMLGIFISSLFWFIKFDFSLINQQQMCVWSNGLQHIQRLELPDGTTVLLGPDSKLTYPNKFTNKERRVKLEGQGFFEVAQNTENPFIVTTPKMEVMALGTAFEIFSFTEEKSAETTLLNGKIKVTLPTQTNNGENEFILTPNHKLSIKGDCHKIEEIDADTYISWREKQALTFIDQPLSVIIPRLERWYGKKILCDKNISNGYRFTFSIDTDSFKDILKFIDRVSVLTVIEEGEHFRILKK